MPRWSRVSYQRPSAVSIAPSAGIDQCGERGGIDARDSGRGGGTSQLQSAMVLEQALASRLSLPKVRNGL